MYGRVFRDDGTNDQPEGVSGRRALITAKPANGVVVAAGRPDAADDQRVQDRLQRGADRRSTASAPVVNGIDLSQPHAEHQRQRRQHRHRRPGRIVGHRDSRRPVCARTARPTAAARRTIPYSLSFIDTLTWNTGRAHLQGRRRVPHDPDGDRSARRHHLHVVEPERLPREHAQQTQYLGDLSDAEPVQQRRDRPAAHRAGVRHRLRAGRVAGRPELTLNYGAALRLLHAADRARRPRWSSSTPSTGVILPRSTTPFQHREEQLPAARVGRPGRPRRRARRFSAAASACSSDPGQTEDQIQPVESDRISSTLSGGAFPVEHRRARRELPEQPEQPQLPAARLRLDYLSPSGSSSTPRRCSRSSGGGIVATAAYVGSQGRNLFLRSIANQIVDVGPTRIPTAPRSSSASSPSSTRDGTISAPVRRGRHQDERRPRQLQRDAAVAGAPLQQRAHAQLAVHAVAQLRQHGRIERGADGGQQRA